MLKFKIYQAMIFRDIDNLLSMIHHLDDVTLNL